MVESSSSSLTSRIMFFRHLRIDPVRTTSQSRKSPQEIGGPVMCRLMQMPRGNNLSLRPAA